MEQKEIIIKTYQQRSCVKNFDTTRSSTYGQQWHNNYEKGLIVNAINDLKKDKIKVLDIACGTGRLAEYVFSSKKNIDYYGVDSSEEMLKEFRKKIANKNLNLLNADACKLPFKDNTFDLTYTFHLLWHVEKKDQVKIIKEMIRVTKDDGIIILDAYNKNFLYNNLRNKTYKKGHEIFRLSIPEIKRILKPLKNVKVFGILDPHIDNKFVFNLMTFLPNKVLRGWYCLHHMLYFKIKKEKFSIEKRNKKMERIYKRLKR